jgi:hypothetical protein
MTLECNFVCPPPADAGPADTGPPADSGGSAACGTTTCAAGDVCVRRLRQGGACVLPDDGGACPAGAELSGSCCFNPPTYSCAPRPAACGSAVTCGCASSLCDPTYVCTAPAGSTPEIDCTLLVP